MIKRINLRGISRTPSDHAAEDGGCAESLNIRLDGGESAPVIHAGEINSTAKDEGGNSLFPPSTLEYWYKWQCIYLHKTNSFTRAILAYYKSNGAIIGIYNGGTSGGEADFTAIVTLEENEMIKDVSSVGNLLVVTTGDRTLRFLFSSSGYRNLSDSIPFPEIVIAESRGSVQQIVKNYTIPPASSMVDSVYEFSAGIWNIKTFNPEVDNVAAMSVAETFAEELRGQIAECDTTYDEYSYPVFAKYTIALYDGSEIESDAFLLWPSELPLAVITAQSNFSTRKCQATIGKNYYDISAYAVDTDQIQALIDTYPDMVKSVRFYITNDITPGIPDTHTRAVATVTSTATNIVNAKVTMENNVTMADVEKVGPFYLIKEVDIADMMSMVSLPYYTNTDRAARQILQASIYDARNVMSASIISSYNNRLLMSGVKERLYDGVHTFPGYQQYESTTGWDSMRLWYYISDQSGQTAIVTGPVLNNEEGSPVNDGLLASYLTYANVRCRKVIVEMVFDSAHIEYFQIDMREHPFINMSYFLCLRRMDFPVLLFDIVSGTESVDGIKRLTSKPAELVNLPDDSDVVSRSSRVYLSMESNPFVMEQSQEFSDMVVGFAPLTKPLSTGQVGQFALYVFTLGGIHSIGINSLGEFSNHVLVSRDACRYPKTIAQLDQAIVYLTDKGLMLLTGSDITDLSKEMNGHPYKVELSLRERLAGSEWQSIVDLAFPQLLIGEDDFISFMKDCEIAYDYAGNRIICLNPAKAYGYTYHFSSGTWHRIITGSAMNRTQGIINAYPSVWLNETYNNEGAEFTTAIKDYTTFFQFTSQTTAEKGMIVTRPLDLDAPDMRKTIKDIQIRGSFNRNDVKYILLGSMDGIHFGVLRSLHGGSYKWFRLVLLTNLQPNERITWVEIDYDTKFMNKLR